MEVDDLFAEIQNQNETSAVALCNPFFDPSTDLPDLSEVLSTEDLFNPSPTNVLQQQVTTDVSSKNKSEEQLLQGYHELEASQEMTENGQQILKFMNSRKEPSQSSRQHDSTLLGYSNGDSIKNENNAAEDTENLLDFLQSFYGDGHDLLDTEDSTDSTSMLNEILTGVDEKLDTENFASEENQSTQESVQLLSDGNNNEESDSQVKRFCGNAKFKAVPAYERCLKVSTDSNVILQPFKIPKPPGRQFTKIVQVDPETDVCQDKSSSNLPTSTNLCMTYATSVKTFTPVITANQPMVVHINGRKDQIISRDSSTARRILPNRVLSQQVPGVDSKVKQERPAFITPKLEAIKATLKGHGRIIQDSYTKELLAKKLKRIQSKNRGPGLLKILPKGNQTLNSQRSLLRNNIQPGTAIQTRHQSAIALKPGAYGLHAPPADLTSCGQKISLAGNNSKMIAPADMRTYAAFDERASNRVRINTNTMPAVYSMKLANAQNYKGAVCKGYSLYPAYQYQMSKVPHSSHSSFQPSGTDFMKRYHDKDSMSRTQASTSQGTWVYSVNSGSGGLVSDLSSVTSTYK